MSGLDFGEYVEYVEANHSAAIPTGEHDVATMNHSGNSGVPSVMVVMNGGGAADVNDQMMTSNGQLPMMIQNNGESGNTLFTFINEYIKTEEETTGHHGVEDVVIDVTEKERLLLKEEKKKKTVIVEGKSKQKQEEDEFNYIFKIYGNRLPQDLVIHILTYLPVSQTTILSRAFENSRFFKY